MQVERSVPDTWQLSLLGLLALAGPLPVTALLWDIQVSTSLAQLQLNAVCAASSFCPFLP